jgi:hypothetical protein
VKLHYLGTAYSDRAHDRCDDYVRQIQAQHMDGNGWSDIGYSFMVCTHGYVYEGRGLRRRNSANGNTALNEQDYAVLLLVGSSGLTKPTDAQLHGARDAIDYCRREGPAGTWLGGHRDGYATACPGEAIYAWVKQGAPRPAASTPSTPPAQEESDMQMSDIVKVTGWIKDRWKDLADGEISVNTALASGYAHSRAANENTAAILTQLRAQTAAIEKLAQLVGSDVDTAQVVAAVERAIAAAVVKVDVDITGADSA